MPDTRCAPCEDSPLATAASVVGILTFVYAILAGLYVNARWGAHALRESPQEFSDLVESLKASFEEYQTFAEHLAEWRDTDRVLASKAAKLADDAEFQLKDLRSTLGTRTPEQVFRSNGKYWWWSAKFALTQRRLRRAVERKNEIMDELRRLQQAFHLKSQENDLLQQHRLLLDISVRLDAVQRHQQLLADNAGIPLEEYSPPGTSWPSAEDILESLMRPRLPRFDRSLYSLALDVPLPRSRQSHETKRSRTRTLEDV